MELVKIVRRLSRAVQKLRFEAPVSHVYNPLEYARQTGEEYLERFATQGCEALFLGMNPGPYGMAQTGVPFGEVQVVRDWMGIEGPVKRPEHEHPKRPIQGFDCQRSEVSGRRLWGWAQNRFPSPEDFFGRFFVWNFCPLLFMEEGGRNRTPDKLPAEERQELYRICDRALLEMVQELKPGRIIGVGKFAESRAKLVLGAHWPVASILHPSPASPAANRGWEAQAEAQLEAMGIRL